MSEIGYFLERARTEIRQAQRATKPEVAIVHYQLAEAYVQRVQNLFVPSQRRHEQDFEESPVQA